jgi:hypothetical protein
MLTGEDEIEWYNFLIFYSTIQHDFYTTNTDRKSTLLIKIEWKT